MNLPFIANKFSRILGIGQRRCKNCFVPFFPDADLNNYPVTDLCPDCLKLCASVTESFCKGCGTPLELNSRGRLCNQCAKEKPAWDAIAFHNFYKDELRELLLKFKFGSALYLAPFFADLLLQAAACLTRPDILVAVPMHHSHICKRGFNQAHEICRELAGKSALPISDSLLKRTRKTVAQEELGAAERRQNLQNSFAARKEAGQYRHVWLIDDILTTGSTMRECCMALKNKGVQKISILFVARTPL